MQVPVIKMLIENYPISVLENAEIEITEEQIPSIQIEGKDDGEKLTHVMAAIWIKKEMESRGTDLITSLRNYTSKVRKSIS